MRSAHDWLFSPPVLGWIAAFGLAAPCASSEVSEAVAAQATIWYLGHCGYAVQTANHFLIFDYIELEEQPTARGLDRGFVDPAEITNLDVTVFVTHSHRDHFDEIILGWSDRIENIRYVFGWPMDEGPGRYSMAGPRAQLELEGMTIRTVNSRHSEVQEVAYLVQIDGLSIVHAGDYQGRMGRNEPSRAVEDMRYLRTAAPVVDVLFLGAWTGDPYLDVLRGLEPKLVFPMHDRKQEHKYLEFADTLRELGFTQPVICPTKRGDRFLLRDGAVDQQELLNRPE